MWLLVFGHFPYVYKDVSLKWVCVVHWVQYFFKFTNLFYRGIYFKSVVHYILFILFELQDNSCIVIFYLMYKKTWILGGFMIWDPVRRTGSCSLVSSSFFFTACISTMLCSLAFCSHNMNDSESLGPKGSAEPHVTFIHYPLVF